MDRYLESEFQGTREAMDDALDAISDAEVLARKAKNSGLWWVYVIEWFITTSTLMISSLLIWSLMVKRRLYMFVSSTRFRETRKESDTTIDET